MKNLFLLTILSGLFLIGCSEDCNELQNEVKNQYGEPEEINTYSSDDYSSTDYWYWSKGIEFTFTYDGKKCEKSTYTFDPITKQKLINIDSINNVKVLVKKEFSTECPTCP